MKIWKQIILFAVLCVAGSFMVPATCQAQTVMAQQTGVPEVVSSGKCGKNVSYRLCKTGKDSYTLRLEGTGKTDDFLGDISINFQYERPWDGTDGDTALLVENHVTRIEVGEGITSIGSAAFADCWNPGLEVSLPSTLKEIGDYAFFCCKMGKVDLPDGLEVIGDHTFRSCVMHEINIPDSVKEIGKDAFADCGYIKQIKLPASLTRLGKGAFSEMKSLQELDNWNDRITEIPESLLCGTAIKTFTVPDVVTKIGRNAFGGCRELTGIYWNGRVREIGDLAFQSSGLVSMVIPDTVGQVGEQVFYDCRNLREITLGKNQKGTLGISSFNQCITLRKIEIPDGITGIGHSAFCNCVSLEDVVIPDSVTEIADSAFYNCMSLETVTVPDSVERIGKKAFYGSKSLEHVRLPEGLKEIESATFRNCWTLRSIKIPKSVKRIGKEAFSDTSLSVILLPDKVNTIGVNAFKNCQTLKMVQLGTGIKTIDKSAFTGCGCLKEIRVPKKKYAAYKKLLKKPLKNLKKVKIKKY